MPIQYNGNGNGNGNGHHDSAANGNGHHANGNGNGYHTNGHANGNGYHANGNGNGNGHHPEETGAERVKRALGQSYRPSLRKPDPPSEIRQFLIDNLDLRAATGVEDARWEPFQIAHLDDPRRFRIENKSRQIAWSWTIAAEAVADAILNRRDSIFVSINLEEAQEKIRYGRQIVDSLRITGLPTITADSSQRLEFSNGARITSLPGRPPRGRARSNVYLDEYAHVQRDREIYAAALPITSKGGRVRIGSSPFGAAGQFWELYTESIRPYPGYTRNLTPWWRTFAFCTDPLQAEQASRRMDQDELVATFGRDRIAEIFSNIVTEDFLQEYCGAFVDEATAWITWKEIKDNQTADHHWRHATVRGQAVDQAMQEIDTLAREIKAGKVERALTAGLDIGRTKDASELFAVGLTTTGQHPLRLAITMESVPFDEQREIVEYALRRLPITQLLIDRNGIGMSLAESLSRSHPAVAYPADFTNPAKRLWATDAKMLLQRREAPLPVDRDLAYQIHSIKRLRTAATAALKFDTDANEKHHADKFWAWALALHASYREKQDRDLGRRQPAHVALASN